MVVLCRTGPGCVPTWDRPVDLDGSGVRISIHHPLVCADLLTFRMDSLPTFLAIIPAASITYRRWQTARQKRAQKKDGVVMSTAMSTVVDGGMELTSSFHDPRQSLRSRQGIYA